MAGKKKALTVEDLVAEELRRRPIARSDFDSLVEYLDYRDHARYSHEELAAMLDGLVTAGLARFARQTWTWKR